MKTFKVLGLMSGTSLDGVDLAICSFSQKDTSWNYVIEKTTTIPYTDDFIIRLKSAHRLSGLEFSILDNELGIYFGELIYDFIKNERIDLIASHGHTIFHQPEIHLTKQIGNGAAIYAKTGIATTCDFRSVDVLLGGQGAPLVPLGDQLLFSEYDYRINLGGIANTSYEENGVTKAYDICPVNQVFNYIAEQLGQPYDDDGNIARNGQLIPSLLNELNALSFYNQSPPKSLGREWVEKHIFSQIENYKLEDFQHTFSIHVATQLANSIKKNNSKILITGGGVYNSFLIKNLKILKPEAVIVIPNDTLISFKEALIFAFLGLRGSLGKPTSLASVTGAKNDSLSMALYGHFNSNNIS